MWPLLYTCACCGAVSPPPTTKYVDGLSNGYCREIQQGQQNENTPTRHDQELTFAPQIMRSTHRSPW
jgi:hypothetical protein